MPHSSPLTPEQLFLLLSAGFSAALLVHHLFTWAARLGSRVHLWAWIWALGALTWCVGRWILVALAARSPDDALGGAELGLMGLLLMMAGLVGVVGTARHLLVPVRPALMALAGSALGLALWVVLGGLRPEQLVQRAGLGAEPSWMVAPGPAATGFALLVLLALPGGLVLLLSRQGLDRVLRGMLLLGLLAWVGAQVNDLALASGWWSTLPLRAHGTLVLGIALTAVISSDLRLRDEELASVMGLHRRNVEEQNRLLVQALVSAREAGEARHRFLARISHELRTPLHGILGMTELALDGELQSTRRRYLENARRSGEELLQLVDDLLDLSRAEAGGLSLVNKAFALLPFLEDTLRVVAAPASARQLELALDAPADLPGTLVGDPLRLRQVLVNLLGNAVKFTEQGEVLLRVQTVAALPGRVGLRFEVRDTGPGIDPADQARILEPFSQGPGAEGRGTGLGLAICVELVKRLGGELRVDSAPGQGSRFSFELQLALPDLNDEITLVDPIALQGVRVLIAEDHPAIAAGLEQELSAWRMLTRRVEDGAGALAELRRARTEGWTYSVLLLDADMPGVDGQAVLEALRFEPGLVASVILMLPARAPSWRFAEGMRLGARAAIGKPIRGAELLEAVLEAVGVTGAPEPFVDPETDPGVPTAGLRVLVADDREVNRELVRAILEAQGCDVVLVVDGFDAIAAMAGERFDLVLMDIGMPGLDGEEATRRIRAWEAETGRTRVPIVALTAHTMPGDRQRMLAAGMDGYLAKPVKRALLEELIERYLHSGSWPSVAPPVEDPPEPPAPPAALPPAVDPQRLRGIVGEDEELLRDLVRLFLDELPRHEERLVEAFERDEAGAVARAAHALRGAASNVAATELQASAASVEESARGGRLEEARRAWPELVAELQRVRPALEALL